MSIRIDYPPGMGEGAGRRPGRGAAPGADHHGPGGPGRGRPRSAGAVIASLLRWAVAGVFVLLAAFMLLVRGGVFAHQQWGLGPWGSLAASGGAMLLVLIAFAWAAGRRFGAGKGLRKFMTRATALAAVGCVAYSLVVIAGGSVKSDEVRAEYMALHPLLRVGVSALVLADSDAVITDASRTPEFYAQAGLPPNESSLHFRQDDGFVHALDLRTRGREEWRNRAAELAFRAMGFHALRHVGTADHLHVSLRGG